MFNQSRTQNLNKVGTYRVDSHDPTKPPLHPLKISWNNKNFPICLHAEEQLLLMAPLEVRLEDYYNIKSNNISVNHKNKLNQALKKKIFGVQFHNQPLKFVPKSLQGNTNGSIFVTSSNAIFNTIQSSSKGSNLFSTNSSILNQPNLYNSNSSNNPANQNTNKTNIFQSQLTTASTQQNSFLNLNNQTNSSANIFNSTTNNNTGGIFNSQKSTNIFSNSTNMNSTSVSNNIFNNNTNINSNTNINKNIFSNNNNTTVNNTTNTNIFSNQQSNQSNISNNLFNNTNTAQPAQSNQNNQNNQNTGSGCYVLPISQKLYQQILRSRLEKVSNKNNFKVNDQQQVINNLQMMSIIGIDQHKNKRTKGNDRVFRFKLQAKNKQIKQLEGKKFPWICESVKRIVYRQPYDMQYSFTQINWQKIKVYETILIEDRYITQRKIVIEIYSDYSLDLLKKLIISQVVEEGIVKPFPTINIINEIKNNGYEITCEIQGRIINLPQGYYSSIQKEDHGKVFGLTIGNRHGQVKWQQVNAELINFQNIISINQDSVTLYGNEDFPPKNVGLNKQYLLTLFECQAAYKFKQNNSYSKQKIDTVLERICKRAGQQFVEYDQYSGYWKIKVSPK